MLFQSVFGIFGSLFGPVALGFGLLALEVGRNAAFVHFVIAPFCLFFLGFQPGIFLVQPLHIRKGGIQVVFGSLGFILRFAYHVPRLFLPGFGSSGTVLLGLDLGHGFLIGFVRGDLTVLDLLH